MRSFIFPPRAPILDLSDWLPVPAETTLDNGLRVIVAERWQSPVVEVRFVVKSGFAADHRERDGLAGFGMAMFGEGALSVGGVRLDVLQEPFGAAFSGVVFADGAIVRVSALAANFSDLLTACARLLANPDFDLDAFERVRARRLALIERERRNPADLALRVLPEKLYGKGHPYARPFSGSGSRASVAALSADQLRQYYEANFTPERMSLVIAGPLTIIEVQRLLENAFGDWNASATLRSPDSSLRIDGESQESPAAASDAKPAVTIVDLPALEQAALAMGVPTVACNSSAAEALIVADAILAGIFSSRLNLKLREERGWTYGVRSSLIDARLGGLWLISSFVRRDCAAAAISEIGNELDNMAGAFPCSPGELAHAVDFLVARIPGTHETCAQLADILARNVIYGFAFDRTFEMTSRLRALEPDDIAGLCRRILRASAVRWVVVGKAAELVSALRNSGFDEIEVLGPDSAP